MKLFRRSSPGAATAWRAAAAALLVVAWGPGYARACRTPVYRYAMYNWPTAPYEVYYLYHGEPAEQDRRVNAKLTESVAQTPAANLAVETVDVSKPQQLERFPKRVEEVWRAQAGGKPLHVILTPWGAPWFAGRLDAAALETMIDSPARRQLAEQLDEGHALVFLVLSGADAAKNRQAEKAAAAVIAKAAAGEFRSEAELDDPDAPGGVPPQSAGGAAGGAKADSGADPAPKPAKSLKLAVLKVSRTDPSEKWLVQSLLAIEPDLQQEKFAKEPMVFAMYGRGRAMPPFVGEGITADNLTECVLFLLGPCSCMIKDENPGVDMLMRWDWDATATKWAADDEDIDGGQGGYREFTPGERGDQGESPGSRQIAAAAPPKNTDTQKTAKSTPAKVSEALQADQQELEDAAPGTTFAAGQLWKLGVGLALGAVAVLVAGFVLIRRQRPQ